MFPAWLAPMIGSLGSLAGGISGLFGRGGGQSDPTFGGTMQQNWRNDDMKFAREQFDFQKDMALNGLKYRMEDAKRSGIHPLFAVGAGAASAGPAISVGTPSVSSGGGDGSYGPDMGVALQRMGQGIDRALSATATKEEKAMDEYEARMRVLNIEGKQLENEATRASIASHYARAAQTAGPAFPNSVVQTTHGPAEMKPPEVPTHAPGSPNIESGPPNPGVRYAVQPNGALTVLPGKDLNMDEFGSPGTGAHYWYNSILPFFSKAHRDQTKPALSRLPKGAHDWQWSPFGWEPMYNRNAFDHLPAKPNPRQYKHPYWSKERER